MAEKNAEKCGLHKRLGEAAVAVESRREELKAFLADPEIKETDGEVLLQELYTFEGMIALADYLQNPGRPLSDLVDASTLIRLKAERNSRQPDITGRHIIPRIHNLGKIVRRVLAEEPGSYE